MISQFVFEYYGISEKVQRNIGTQYEISTNEVADGVISTIYIKILYQFAQANTIAARYAAAKSSIKRCSYH